MSSSRPLLWARCHVADAVALALILLLVFVFYCPRANPLESRYVYFADPFERERSLYNPECDDTFTRKQWESISPVSCLLARAAMALFRDDPGKAVLTRHMSIIFASAIATYLLSRLYLAWPTALLVSVFLFCGRVLLPPARGLGLSHIHLLIPLSLVLLRALSLVSETARPELLKLCALVAGSVSIACIYVLGCHETIYAAACAAMGLTAAGIWWIIRSIRKRRVVFRPALNVLATFVLGAAMGVGLMWMIHRGLPERVGPSDLRDMILYESYRKAVMRDVDKEPGHLRDRPAVWRGTFIAGRYLTPYGRHHENLFLYPGDGFNGIIPLFLVPGLAIGLIAPVCRVLHRPKARPSPVDREGRHFDFFVVLLLCLFLAALATGADAKPTRYTYSILAILIVGGRGYERLFRWLDTWIKGRSARPGHRRRQAWQALCLVCVPLLALAGMRLKKNYDDLGVYLSEYAHQIPTIALWPTMEEALRQPRDREVAVYCPVPPVLRHPAVGLRLSFRLPPNVHLVSDRKKLAAFAPETLILRPRTMPKFSPYYFTARRNWPGATPQQDAAAR